MIAILALELCRMAWAGPVIQIPPVPVPSPSPTPAPAWFPFVIPPFDAEKTATDVSWLNSVPAGSSGFLRAQGEHFVDGSGRLVRLWGVNISFEGAFPPKDQAPQIAAHLAKFGFNAVRFHQYEGYGAPRGIWKGGSVGPLKIQVPREIDPAQLDKFDFFASELIKHGIYIDLNQHVGRQVEASEGFPNAAGLPEKDKGPNYYDPKLIAAQKEFTRFMLTHVNPYTGRAWCDEPGLCAVELDNESSLLANFLDDTLLDMPSDYRQPLQEKWNAWLRAHYTEEQLRAAWTQYAEPPHWNNLLEVSPARNPDGRPVLQEGLALNELRRFQFVAREPGIGGSVLDANGGELGDGAIVPSLNVRIEKAGADSGAFQMHRDGLNLHQDHPYTLTFRARASSPRRLEVGLGREDETGQDDATLAVDLTTSWMSYRVVLRGPAAEPGEASLSWILANEIGTAQLCDIELREGGRLGAPDDWTLAKGVPLLNYSSTSVPNVRRDFAEFLGSVESAYFAEMRAFLHNELHVKCPVWLTQAQFGGWGGVQREMAGDVIDVHAYWKHPDYSPGADGSRWRVGNLSMTTAAGSDPLSAFGLFRVAGKPFVMSEWNTGQPSDFSAEALPMVASYAAWQDWAGVFIFDYHSSGPYLRDKFFEFFSIDTHPAKMATAPASAFLFRRPEMGRLGDVEPAHRQITLTMPPADIWPEVADDPGEPSAYPIQKTWYTSGGARTTGLAGRTAIRFADTPFPTVSRAHIDTATSFTSDTGQIEWARSDPPHFSVDTPKSKLAVGFYAGRAIQLNGFHIEVPRDAAKYELFALSSLDGEDIGRSHRLLFAAVARVENKDMIWNMAHNSLISWGTGPTMAEGVAGRVRLALAAGHWPEHWKVWALDGYGNRREQLPAQFGNGVLYFDLDSRFATLWYEVVRQ